MLDFSVHQHLILKTSLMNMLTEFQIATLWRCPESEWVFFIYQK